MRCVAVMDALNDRHLLRSTWKRWAFYARRMREMCAEPEKRITSLDCAHALASLLRMLPRELDEYEGVWFQGEANINIEIHYDAIEESQSCLGGIGQICFHRHAWANIARSTADGCSTQSSSDE